MNLLWDSLLVQIYPFLCLRASKSRIAALTDTLRESSLPRIGIRMCLSAASLHKLLSPVDSVPTTMAVPQVISVS